MRNKIPRTNQRQPNCEDRGWRLVVNMFWSVASLLGIINF